MKNSNTTHHLKNEHFNEIFKIMNDIKSLFAFVFENYTTCPKKTKQTTLNIFYFKSSKIFKKIKIDDSNVQTLFAIPQ